MSTQDQHEQAPPQPHAGAAGVSSGPPSPEAADVAKLTAEKASSTTVCCG